MNFPENCRIHPPFYESNHGDKYGVFLIKDGADRLFCIATDGECPGLPGTRWEHVSVSVRNRRGIQLQRCPTWEQMAKIKDTFWPEDQAVMQLHPPQSDYVNLHPFCLHLWRPVEQEIPLPPSNLV